MKTSLLAFLVPISMTFLAPAFAEEKQDNPKDEPDIELPEIEYPKPETESQIKAAAKHREGSQNLAGEQDELAADVQDLIEEQTDEKVIALL